MSGETPILIAYDGSAAARAAVQAAGELFGPRLAIVLTVWESGLHDFMLAPDPTGMGSTMLPYDPAVAREIDHSSEDHAKQIARDGQTLAEAAGLEAQAFTIRDLTDTADIILQVAKEREVAAIVVGSRGLRGLKSKLLGSTSAAVLQRATIPVLVISHPKDHRHQDER